MKPRELPLIATRAWCRGEANCRGRPAGLAGKNFSVVRSEVPWRGKHELFENSNTSSSRQIENKNNAKYYTCAFAFVFCHPNLRHSGPTSCRWGLGLIRLPTNSADLVEAALGSPTLGTARRNYLRSACHACFTPNTPVRVNWLTTFSRHAGRPARWEPEPTCLQRPTALSLPKASHPVVRTTKADRV